jgi:large subunit ribosomal protein L18
MATDRFTLKRKSRIRRAGRVRRKVRGTAERPRLAVFKSLRYVYAQLIDDTARKTIVGVSSLKGSLNVSGRGMEQAKAVGKAIAGKARELGIKDVVFDRSGYIYHGKVKALAEAAREEGLNF